MDGLQTCSRCGYKLNLCSCSSVRDRERSSKYSEDGFKVYSEKFKNKRLVLVPEETKKKVNSDSEDDEPKRGPAKKLGMKERPQKAFISFAYLFGTTFLFRIHTVSNAFIFSISGALFV